MTSNPNYGRNGTSRFRVFTVNMPREMLKSIDMMIEAGWACSRSEFFRIAVTDYLIDIYRTSKACLPTVAAVMEKASLPVCLEAELTALGYTLKEASRE
jgi:metal-responsive CopG/Arc/MetJ family transcriptional regulator